jgi:hypothetical protein
MLSPISMEEEGSGHKLFTTSQQGERRRKNDDDDGCLVQPKFQ